MDDDAKKFLIVIAAIVCVIVFLASPFGKVLFTILGWIPGGLWPWIWGAAALGVLLLLFRWWRDS